MHFAFYVVLLCFSVTSLASKLPPEHESARLLLVLEEAVNQKDWSLADQNLNKMADLQIELPVPFYFYNGLVHYKQNRLEKAQLSLEHYIVKVGPSGAFYYDALRLVTMVEAAMSEQSALNRQEVSSVDAQTEPDGQQRVSSLIVNEERDAYIQSLKALFLTDSPVQALVMQINSLLSAHSFTGSRVKKPVDRVGIQYQISIQENMVVVQEKNFQEGFPQLSATRLGVSGIDPFIKYDCSKKDLTCWLYHPAKKHERWLLIGFDSLVVSELGQAFTRLIQLLQKQ